MTLKITKPTGQKLVIKKPTGQTLWLITPQLKTIEGIPWDQIPANRKWTPADIATALWLDAADASTVTTVSGAVSQWNDKSGNGRNVTQASAVNRPAYGSLQINERNTLTFGGNNSLVNFSPGLVTGASARCMFAVYKPNTTGSSSNNICGQSYNGTVTGSWFMLQHRNDSVVGDPYFAGYANDLTDGVTPTTAAKIGGVTYDGSSLVLYRNGNQIANKTTTLVTGETTSFIIGRSGQNAEFMNGSIAEIVFTESALTATTRQRIEGYLAHKWGLTANLPSNHPYKTVSPTP